MPEELERELKARAAADPDIRDKDAYVYGTLRKTGWKPSRRKKRTGNDAGKALAKRGGY